MKEIIEAKSKLNLTDRDILGYVVQKMDEGQDFLTGSNNYIWFYLIGKHFRPKVIVEFGSRYGYSLKCFVNGAGHKPNEYKLWVYDSDCDGLKALPVFEKYFRVNMDIQDIFVNKVDTRDLKYLDMPYDCDLCMVDACHTESGAYHECRIGFDALKPKGVLVVDDILNPDVKKGTERFCNENKLKTNYLPSLRGIYLIRKTK